jgi:glycosyltransferase involved in cell wall biosynthesis
MSHIHLWLPNIFQFKGGIQVYSAFLLQTLQTLYPQYRYDVFLKHDTATSAEFSFLDHTQFHFSGQWPLAIRTPHFALQLLAHGVKKQPDLVITTHLNFTEAAYTLKKMTGIPYWAIAHGVEAWGIEKPALQRALQNADRILAVSEYTRDRLLSEQALDPDRVIVLPNTFDESRFQIAPKPNYLLNRYNLSPDQPVLLTVARLDSAEQYKGYDNLIRSLPEIRSHIPNVHYVLVGKGNDQPRIRQLIADLNLEASVTLAGFIPDAEIGDHYNLCDIFVMPSKGEGFGIVYLEALACGKPTVGGNQDGAIDALCGGNLGVLIDPDNIAGMAQILIQILHRTYSHPILYQPEVLREKVIATYGLQKFQQTLLHLLNTSPLTKPHLSGLPTA